MSTAVILAGGESSRMGYDKQKLSINQEHIMTYQVKTLGNVFDQIIIISNNELSDHLKSDEKVSIYSDVLKHKGPLGGIHSGLLHSFDENVFVIACDMPEINVKYIEYLMTYVADYDAVVTSYGNWIEPFHGFYSKRIIKDIEQYLISGRRHISGLLMKMHTYYVPENVARIFSPDWTMFDNINTIKDLKLRKKSE